MRQMVASMEPDVSREKARSNERFLALLEPVYDRLEAYARAITDSREDARDLVSETVLRALEGIGRVSRDGAFLSYLFTIASRVARRARWRRRLFAVLPDGAADGLRASTPSPEYSTDVALLRDALERLPVRQREAVMLHEIVGMPIAEIAVIQGGSAGAAKVRVHRARQRLAEMLGVGPDDPLQVEREQRETSGDADTSLLTFASNPGGWK
jgi:RNA polymerase sigma-70 factor (ECF subfamily)